LTYNMNLSNSHFFDALGKSIDVIKENEIINSYLVNQEAEEIGDRFYVTNRKKGIGFVFDEFRTLIAIHFHSGNSGSKKESYSSFTGLLPYDIRLEDSIESAHKKIGLKEFDSGGGEILPILGLSNRWRKYNYQNFYLTIEFNKDGALVLTTLGLIR
jgi:hypothetical protein